MEEDIFMEQPEGFINEEKRYFVYKLFKALYGLKQASRVWYNTIDAVLKAFGCKQSSSDSSLYTLRLKGATMYIYSYTLMRY